MEQYEYGNFLVWGMSNENGQQRSSACTLETAAGHTYLQNSTVLAALNEIGLDGWVVYNIEGLGGGTFPSYLIDEHESRNGFRPRSGSSMEKREVRRVRPSVP